MTENVTWGQKMVHFGVTLFMDTPTELISIHAQRRIEVALLCFMKIHKTRGPAPLSSLTYSCLRVVSR